MQSRQAEAIRAECEARGIRLTPKGRGIKLTGHGVDIFVTDLGILRLEDLSPPVSKREPRER
jgi:hypothetical protein